MKKPLNIGIIGDGGWGTTLGIMLFRSGFKPAIWGAFPDYTAYMSKKRENKKFLPGIKIPKAIEITNDLKRVVEDKGIIIFAAPSQYIREILKQVKALKAAKDAVILSVTKGIEVNSLKRVSEIITEELRMPRLAVLSGPTIAYEVARGIPSVAVIASGDAKLRAYLQDIFTSDRFRVYTSDDVIGVELGGSLKNVIAIACGISDGLGFGANTKAALLSRGLAEISRLGLAMGAKEKTFSGISGLGDLVTTCISPFSRNRSVGEQIGKGKSIKQIQLNMQQVAEGVLTAKSAYALSLKYKADMPIAKEVYDILYKNKPPLRALNDLMERQTKEE